MVKNRKNQSNAPHFICIGPQKTGTSWLHSVIGHHKEAKRSSVKELDYFYRLENKELKYGILKNVYYNVLRLWLMRKTKYLQIKKYLKAGNNREKKERLRKIFEYDLRLIIGYYPFDYYCSFFNKPNYIMGDISPSYFFLNKKSIYLIKEYFPKVKIIIFLREPVDRNFSHTKMEIRNQSISSSVENIHKYSAKIKKSEKNSYPLEGLQNWLDVFEKEQVFIGFYDKLKEDPVKYFRKICQFLSISDDIEDAIEFKGMQRPLLIKGKRQIIKFTSAKQLLSFRYNNGGTYIPLPKELELSLIEHYYKKVQGLSSLLDSPYPNKWLEKYDLILKQWEKHRNAGRQPSNQ